MASITEVTLVSERGLAGLFASLSDGGEPRTELKLCPYGRPGASGGRTRRGVARRGCLGGLSLGNWGRVARGSSCGGARSFGASGLHAKKWLDLGDHTVGAGQELTVAVVEAVSNVSVRLGGDVQEQLAVTGADPEPIGEGPDAVRFGCLAAAGIVETEVNKRAAAFVQADAQEDFAGGCIHEGDRRTWPSMS